jgi:hypothetical protein
LTGDAAAFMLLIDDCPSSDANMPRYLNILILVCAVVHVGEEFFFDWVHWAGQFVPGVTVAQFVFWNAAFLALCIAGIALPWVVFRLSLAWLVILNTWIHLAPSLVFWQYSPGLVSALVLYLPVGVFVYAVAYRRAFATPREILLSVPLGAAWMAVPFVYQAFRVLGTP